MAISATAAREEVLRRIRAALGGASTDAEVVGGDWAGIDRGYRHSGTLGRAAVLEELEDRLRDYDAHVEQSAQSEVTAKIAELLSARGVRRLVVPRGLAEAIGAALPQGFDFVQDDGLSAVELDHFDGVVTGCTVAISQTGTLILQTVPGQGRRAPTLVPDYHLCLVRADDVVETVPEAMDRLQRTASLATTFVSGPSATADIEMTRIKGVHGPRFLDVVVIV
jgi:L-lactate dehydrogenase complex protein LldG